MIYKLIPTDELPYCSVLRMMKNQFGRCPYKIKFITVVCNNCKKNKD